MLNTLSPIVFGKICRYLNEDVIPRLRQVSKTTMNIVSKVAITQNTTVFSMISSLSVGTSDKIQMSFYFKNYVNCTFWKYCFISLLIKLGFDYKESLFLERNNRHMQLELFLVYQKMESLLQHLKPLFCRVQISDMNVSNVLVGKNDIQLATNIIYKLANFLEGKSLKSLSIEKAESENFHSWIKLVSNVRIECTKLRMNFFDTGAVKFILQLSDFTSSLKLNLDTYRNSSLVSLLLRGMSTRKCVKIAFKSFHTLDIQTIEQLIKVISSLNKNIYFSAFTNLRQNSLTVGAFE
ncbi:hypothetical protein PRIPAC_71022, partial [Pristionchus pacificus]|uniref:Uncharacterized protein n=1 Tax=Pristionchus pacificus TaxID=54126 RepID=A0A2A6BDJ9_PRIPA